MIHGKWYDNGSAAQSRAALSFENERYTLTTEREQVLRGKLENIVVSDRLGNIERKLSLSDGSVFTTLENDAIDRVFKPYASTNSVLHSLESNMNWVLVALALVIITTFSFFKWGIPWFGNTIAHALPQKTNDLIGANTLEFLDDYLFEPSELEEFQTSRIRDHFQQTIVPLEQAATRAEYTLHFRAWGTGSSAIPNALALPSGDIILTDKFVELSRSQDEIDSVLLHEMGHVEHRHTLETVIQGALMTTVIVLITGDASGATDMGVGLGSLLLSSSYSRGNESEADLYAFEKMLRAGIDPNAFADIMERITNYGGIERIDAENGEETKKTANEDSEKETILDYLSTHPRTEKRIFHAKRYAQCYKKGLVVCDFVQGK